MCDRIPTPADPIWADLTKHQREVATTGNCPVVNPHLPTLTYADIFPGRVWVPRVAADLAPDYARGLAA